ncbi:MAG: outer membrane beta-barrel protein [Deltaproteobacteria bacterium]|nr:outer membrane beta-barrel protein [Deltaproteobacteria bacterium]
MKRFPRLFLASLALCLLPTLALAQPMDVPHEQPAPPPGMQPQPAARPAPAYQPGYQRVRPGYGNTMYSRYRTNWYIGFGVGGGSGWVSNDNGGESTSEGGVAINFKVGAVVTPQLLIGFEASAWRYQDSNDFAIQFNHYDGVATFFPIHDGGFFLKGGLGLGVALLDYGGEIQASTEAGFDVKAGLGYEFQVGRSLNIGADLSYGMTKYDDGATHDLGLHLTLVWY